MDHAAATLQDVGAALAYVGQSAVDIFGAVTAAPMMAASGMNTGVKGLPLPGHEAHTVAWSETPLEQTYSGPYGSTHRPGADGPVFGEDRPVFARQEEQAGRGVPLPALASSATYRRPVPGLPRGLPSVQPSAARPPSWTSPALSGTDGQGVQLATPSPAQPTLMKQPSAKIVGGTLGLPRAGFSSAYRSPTPDSVAQSAGFYGRNKTGGMSVA